MRTTCGTCSKATFAGCGAHLDRVLGDVAVDKLCSCAPLAEYVTKRQAAAGAAK